MTNAQMALPVGVITLTDQEQLEVNGGELSSLALLGWAITYTVIGAALVVLAVAAGGVVYALSH